MKKIPLHLQIVIALILGAVFGALFSVNQNLIEVVHREDSSKITTEISDWEKVYFLQNTDTLKHYSSQDQIQIIEYFKNLSNKKKREITLLANLKEDTVKVSNLLAIKKQQTAATYISPIGDLFIRLLSFLAIPLVIATLIVGAASLTNLKKLGRIGIKTFTIYIVTTTIAISLGLFIANVSEPGKQVDQQSKNRLLGAYQEESAEKAVETLDIDLLDFLVEIVPKNPFSAIGSGNMLQIVFFAVIFGITLTLIEAEKRKSVVNFFEGVSDTMIKMVDVIMLMAPFGVFALISATIADFGFNILQTLIWYSIAVIVGLLIQTTLVYGSLVKLFSKVGVLDFFKGIRNAQAIGFSTSSSAATLPITMDNVEKNIGVRKEISGFVLPLGATINMDGTALYQGVAAVFISQVYGFDLSIAEQLTVVLTAVLASIGTAPVPGVGIIMLVVILNSINVPAEGIALILGVDRILDMMRTITNVTGDAAVAVAIDGSEK